MDRGLLAHYDWDRLRALEATNEIWCACHICTIALSCATFTLQCVVTWSACTGTSCRLESTAWYVHARISDLEFVISAQLLHNVICCQVIACVVTRQLLWRDRAIGPRDYFLHQGGHWLWVLAYPTLLLHRLWEGRRCLVATFFDSLLLICSRHDLLGCTFISSDWGWLIAHWLIVDAHRCASYTVLIKLTVDCKGRRDFLPRFLLIEESRLHQCGCVALWVCKRHFIRFLVLRLLWWCFGLHPACLCLLLLVSVEELIKICDSFIPHTIVYLLIHWCCLFAWRLLYAVAVVILICVGVVVVPTGALRLTAPVRRHSRALLCMRLGTIDSVLGWYCSGSWSCGLINWLLRHTIVGVLVAIVSWYRLLYDVVWVINGKALDVIVDDTWISEATHVHD